MTLRSALLASCVAASLTACVSPPEESRGGDGARSRIVRLGDVQLREGKDLDVVRLPSCKRSANDRVSQLRVAVRGHAAELDRLRVVYQNGDSQVLSVKQRFAAGDRSRWIDLDGKRRCIEKIVVLGDADTLGWRPGAQARVVFLGR
jgi:hypothetical protein